MTQYAITDTYLTNTADAIRAKLGTSGTITPANFAAQIGNISTLPSGVELIYEGDLTVSTTSSSYTNELTLTGTFSNYDAIVMTVLPQTASTSAGYFIRGNSSLVKNRNDYPDYGYGTCVYLDPDGDITFAIVLSTGNGIYLYGTATTLYVRSRCYASTTTFGFTNIDGTFHTIILGISNS